jgi:hypothetical protein
MTVSLLVPWALAALTTAPSPIAPSGTPVSASVHDIAPPVDIPYPLWMVVAAAAGAVAVLILLIWAIVAWARRRPAPPPPTPTAIALRELERLRAKAREMEPYLFSVAVSDVLRTFISDAKFRLPATRQTSPEFLAAIAGSKLFTESDRSLLGHFLEKCDLIKFARLQATSADNLELVESALAFVQGERSLQEQRR